MRYPSFIAFSLLAGSLVGCGSMPRTPELMVQNAKDGKMATDKDMFEVKRPLSQVTAVLKKKSEECFQQQIEVKWRQNGLIQRRVIALTPKLDASNGRTQLTLQQKTIAGATELGGIPSDGWYILVVNAYPVDNGTTRVETYFQHTDFKKTFTAIKPWVNGTNMGCPDLTS